MIRSYGFFSLFFFCLVASAAAGKLDSASAALQSEEYGEARELLKPLAIEGDAEAQYMLGNLYIDGHAGEGKKATGVRWLTMAAKQDHYQAATELGKMYASGHGVPMDQEESEKWYAVAGQIGKEQGKKEEECE